VRATGKKENDSGNSSFCQAFSSKKKRGEKYNKAVLVEK
jgi:hypothetical protein